MTTPSFLNLIKDPKHKLYCTLLWQDLLNGADKQTILESAEFVGEDDFVEFLKSIKLPKH